jgi:amino acid permease
MSRPETVRSLRDRFAIGASLIPPVALLMIASRAGWVPGSPRVYLAAMPVVLGLGMLFPTLAEPWHRRFSRMRSWLGGRLVFLLLLGVYGVAVVPLAFLMRLFGKRPLDVSRSGSSWVQSKGYGSLRDPF